MIFSNPYNCSSVSQRESTPPNGSLHVSLLLMWCRPSVQKMLQYKLPQNTMFLAKIYTVASESGAHSCGKYCQLVYMLPELAT